MAQGGGEKRTKKKEKSKGAGKRKLGVAQANMRGKQVCHTSAAPSGPRLGKRN
jgi:hypothetical protein